MRRGEILGPFAKVGSCRGSEGNIGSLFLGSGWIPGGIYWGRERNNMGMVGQAGVVKFPVPGYHSAKISGVWPSKISGCGHIPRGTPTCPALR